MGWLIVLMILIGALGLLIAGDATLFGLDWPDLAAAGFLAAFLIVTGIKMFFAGDEPMDVGNNRAVKFISRHMRVTRELHEQHFFVRVHDDKTGKLVLAATPLFLALVVINLADLVFAVDSVPAIFAITTDTFIVYTSNIMAILGLRALYFALSAMIHRFHYLKYALAAVLVFIGSKIFVADFLMDGAKFPPLLSLGVTAALIGAGIGYSLWRTGGEEEVDWPVAGVDIAVPTRK